MPTWNDLFAQGQLIARFPQREVLKFAALLETTFVERPLQLWDLCCGAGRHVVALAGRGHEVFASDVAPNGIAHTQALLTENNLSATLAVADMTLCPWPGQRFHGVLSWDSLHHNKRTATESAVAQVYEQLIPGGLFLVTLKSSKADSFGLGAELEPGTFVRDDGYEAGVPHHFYNETEIHSLFADWSLLALVEQVMDYRERGPDFYEVNPFAYTRWGILARKPGGQNPAG